MSSQHFPIIGNWYKDSEDRLFEVIALDETDNYIEIQYFGGDIDELEYDTWYGLQAETVPPPEDWTGPYDEIEADDLGYSDLPAHFNGYSMRLEEID